jgi:hypothetical protein
MKSLFKIVFVSILFFITVPMFAEEKIQVTGSYQSLWSDQGFRLNGFVVAGQYNFKSWLALEGEYAFDTKTVEDDEYGKVKSNDHVIQSGPKFTYRSKLIDLWGHILVGYGSSTQSAGIPMFEYDPDIRLSANAKALMITPGVGVDVNLTDKLYFRGALDLENFIYSKDLGTDKTERITLGVGVKF